MKSSFHVLVRRRHPLAMLVLGALAFGVVTNGVALAGGSHPGDEPTPVLGDWPEGTAVKFFDPSLMDLTDECVPKLPNPLGPLVELVVGHWDTTAVDSVAGYDMTNCRFIAPADLCGVLDPDPVSWTPVAGDWDGDGIDTLAVYDSAACDLRDPSELDLSELPQPDADAWRYLAGEWEGHGVDSLAVARPRNIGDGDGGLLLSGNFAGTGETFAVFDPESGFTTLEPESLATLRGAPTKRYPLWACSEWEIECWELVIPGAPQKLEICQWRRCCLGEGCYDYVTYN